MAKKDILAVLDLAMAAVKDAALADCLRRVDDAQRAYLIAEADKNREKSKAVIKAIVRIDIECRKLILTYDSIKNDLGEDGQEIMDELMGMLEKERTRLVEEKKSIS